MKTAKPNRSTELDRPLVSDIAINVHELTRTNIALRQVDDIDEVDEVSADNLHILLRRVTNASTHAVETLIDELDRLRSELESDGDRIQNDIARYAELSQGAMQLAAIISDSVKKIPGAPSIGA
jgi:hypothetical protein